MQPVTEILGQECRVCKTFKVFEEFNRNPGNSSGYDFRCKECLRAYRRTEKYRESQRLRQRRDYADPDKRKKLLEYLARYNRSPKGIETRRAYYQDPEIQKKLRLRPKDPQRNMRNQRKFMSNPRNRLSNRISASVRRCILKENKSWVSILGYTLEDLTRHLESRFEPGMTWENYGRAGWSVDHILPVSSFEFSGPGDPGFRACWALSNLMPRWTTTSIAKANGSSRMGNINKGGKILEDPKNS